MYTAQQKEQFFLDGYSIGKKDALNGNDYKNDFALINGELPDDEKYELRRHGYHFGFEDNDPFYNFSEEEVAQL